MSATPVQSTTTPAASSQRREPSGWPSSCTRTASSRGTTESWAAPTDGARSCYVRLVGEKAVVRPQQTFDHSRFASGGEVKAGCAVATQLAQHVNLRRRLHAFGHRVETQGVGQIDHRLDDGA